MYLNIDVYDRTGAIHIGDLLLAINGEMMKGRTLTEATEMLQNAEDLITLKIARPIEANSKVYKVITYIA